MNISNLHGNSERPAYYQAWLCVSDSALPLKGTGHRRNSHEDAPKDIATSICIHTQSELWRLQGFQFDCLPKAVAEGDFHVPSARAHLTCNDARRNLTDIQETSQWVSGEEFWSKIFSSLWSALLNTIDWQFFQILCCSVFSFALCFV